MPITNYVVCEALMTTQAAVCSVGRHHLYFPNDMIKQMLTSLAVDYSVSWAYEENHSLVQ